MGNETSRNWTVIAGVVAALAVLLLAAYTGAYFATVIPAEVAITGAPSMAPIYPECEWLVLYWFFGPVHEFDRSFIRHRLWNP